MELELFRGEELLVYEVRYLKNRVCFVIQASIPAGLDVYGISLRGT